MDFFPAEKPFFPAEKPFFPAEKPFFPAENPFFPRLQQKKRPKKKTISRRGADPRENAVLLSGTGRVV